MWFCCIKANRFCLNFFLPVTSAVGTIDTLLNKNLTNDMPNLKSILINCRAVSIILSNWGLQIFEKHFINNN